VGHGPFSSLILVGAQLATTTFNLDVEIALRPLITLDIPVDPGLTQFQTTVTDGSDPGTFKIDFSDYDFNGDGIKEGCTGCTCPVGCGLAACPASIPEEDLKPVCYRVWFRPQGASDFTQFIAGVFRRLATRDDPATPEDEENPGAGFFRRATFGFSPDTQTQMGVTYNHRDPTDARHQLSQVADRTEFTAQDGSKSVSLTNIEVEQIGLDNPQDPLNLQKTVRATSQSTDPQGQSDVLQYRGRFREDADFFSGKVVNPGGEVPLFCAQISTGNAAMDAASCDNLGISVANLDFLPILTPADFELPADFPVTPTF
jgi:hypothetical protein